MKFSGKSNNHNIFRYYQFQGACVRVGRRGGRGERRGQHDHLLHQGYDHIFDFKCGTCSYINFSQGFD